MHLVSLITLSSSPLIVYLACSVQATADNCHGNHVLPPLLHAAVICAAGQICEYLLPGIFERTCHFHSSKHDKAVIFSNVVMGSSIWLHICLLMISVDCVLDSRGLYFSGYCFNLLVLGWKSRGYPSATQGRHLHHLHHQAQER